MTRDTNGGPAYPILKTDTHDTWPGMSLRDAAALAALQGFCSQTDSSGLWSWLPDMAAAEVWRMADAFIAARETKEGEG
jgi:hypothetical protein